MVDCIHHINFLVKDLDTAVERYKVLLGDVELHYGDLEGRGVRTARFRLGESWLVLVQPTTADSVPARHLAQHGEGFFCYPWPFHRWQTQSTKCLRAAAGYIR